MGSRNLLHSVNRNQQGNSGDSHKLSCGFKMFTRMICLKTCGSFKWYEQVKTTTKNEGKNTVDGDRTSDVDEIKEKGNSNGITEKGNSDKIVEKGNSDKIVEKGNSDKIAEKGNSDKIAEKGNSDKIVENEDVYGTFIEMNGDKTVEEVNVDDTSEKVIGCETAENVTIESRENTTTNFCATENRDASYGRLDVGSLISSGKY